MCRSSLKCHTDAGKHHLDGPLYGEDRLDGYRHALLGFGSAASTVSSRTSAGNAGAITGESQ